VARWEESRQRRLSAQDDLYALILGELFRQPWVARHASQVFPVSPAKGSESSSLTGPSHVKAGPLGLVISYTRFACSQPRYARHWPANNTTWESSRYPYMTIAILGLVNSVGHECKPGDRMPQSLSVAFSFLRRPTPHGHVSQSFRTTPDDLTKIFGATPFRRLSVTRCDTFSTVTRNTPF
jgi:hypothetical protein